ncbi:MAG: acetyltransferase [Maricaulis sp.]|nr:acetyltransferase [Maricaulis sp.]
MHKAWEGFENAWARHFLTPHFDEIGVDPKIVLPWHVEVFGPNITAGERIHIVATAADPVRLTVWSPQTQAGKITLGSHVFLAPGTKLLAAGSIELGDDCLIANRVTISDCDWHSIHDRVDPQPAWKPVKLERNVWIGDGAYIGKGVTIGEHAVVGARSVVVKDVEPYTIVAGNPAKVIRRIDPNEPMRARSDMFADPAGMDRFFDTAYQQALKGNSTLGWLRSRLFPRRGN